MTRALDDLAVHRHRRERQFVVLIHECAKRLRFRTIFTDDLRMTQGCRTVAALLPEVQLPRGSEGGFGCPACSSGFEEQPRLESQS